MSKFYSVPYRWMPKTFFRNVKSIVEDLFWYVPRNMIRWAPVIWRDADFDWSFLAEIMEYKISRMAEGFEKYGHHIGSEKSARRMRVCSHLLRRLIKNEYFKNTDKGFPRYKYSGTEAGKLAKQDEELLFTIMRKHWRGWWD